MKGRSRKLRPFTYCYGTLSLEMAQRLRGSSGFSGCKRRIGPLCVFLERAADHLAGAEAYGESKREHDAAEENAKGQLDDGSADLEMVEHHSRGKDKDEPLNAQGQKTRVLETCIDGADEDGTLQEPGDEIADDEKDDGAYRVSQVRQKEG